MAKAEGIKILADNRRARHEYFFVETFEAGVMLSGAEVKSARAGKVQLSDAYAAVKDGELFLYNAHISPYLYANQFAGDPRSVRKLLMHRREIDRLRGKTREKGLTLIPTKVYLKQGRVKVELALAQGKQHYDKRETERKREAEEEARRAVTRR